MKILFVQKKKATYYVKNQFSMQFQEKQLPSYGVVMFSASWQSCTIPVYLGSEVMKTPVNQ